MITSGHCFHGVGANTSPKSRPYGPGKNDSSRSPSGRVTPSRPPSPKPRHATFCDLDDSHTHESSRDRFVQQPHKNSRELNAPPEPSTQPDVHKATSSDTHT